MSKKILIAGGTGLIGKELSAFLHAQGHEVRILSRKKRDHPRYAFFKWDLEKDFIEEGALDVDCIIHLAGEGIAGKRWTVNQKKKIIDSRVKSIDLLRRKLSELGGSKPAYIGASAIGIYGESDEHALSESEVSDSEDSFIVEVTRKWEEAHHSIKPFVGQWALLRIGIVLSPKGGALKPMLVPFLFRIGNYFGNGSQIFSWIHVQEVCRIAGFLLDNNLSGIFNTVGPNPVNGRQLINAIAQVKGGPFIKFGAPRFVLKLIFGEMSEAILMSTWASADALLAKGYEFNFPTIAGALEDLLVKDSG